jgi:uncharacterized protein YbjT (DUF2867 family)
MRIGVSGASGKLGRAVVAGLVQRAGGHEVVAISRTPESAAAPARSRFGDYDRPESLAEAMPASTGSSSSRRANSRAAGARRRTSPPSTPR